VLRSRLVCTLWLLVAAHVGAGQVFADAGAWRVPGDPEELRHACAGQKGLETFGQNPHLGIECGAQAALLGGDLPLGAAAHVPWAKPYARGPIKLLMVTAAGYSPADVEQLAQVARALDAQVRWLMIADVAVTAADKSDYAYRTQFLPARARALLREDYDAIVMSFGTVRPGFGHTPAHGYFPDDVYATILDKVRRGTGLVIVGQYVGGFWVERTPLAAALPAQRTPEHVKLQPGEGRVEATSVGAAFRGVDFTSHWFTPWIMYGWQLRPDARVLAHVAGRPAVMMREHGRGRVVLLGWDGTLGPEHSGSRTELEHGTALGLRAITYAARKEPELQLELGRGALPAGVPGSLIARASQAARLELSVRDDTFRAQHVLAVKLRAGASAIGLPGLAKGAYFLQWIAKDAAGRVLSWGDQRLDVESPQTLSLSTDREIYGEGDVVQVSARSSGLQTDPQLRATWEVKDATGRVLARETRAFEPDARFAYTIRVPRVAPHKVTLALSRADAPLLRATARFFVPGSRWHDWENVLWGSKLNTQLRDAGGFTAVFDGWGQDVRSHAAAHFGLNVARLNDGLLDPALIQTRPAQAEQEHAPLLQRAVATAQRHGALFWLLQDERGRETDPGMPDAEGQARYQKYLQAQYGSLAALNASWGTRHARWDQIRPTLTKDIQRGVKNLAPWVDFRLHVADQAFQMDAAQARTVRAALGAHTPVGLDAFTSSRHVLPYGAIDFGRLAAEGVFDFYAPYADDFVIASLVKGPKAKYVGWSMSRADYFAAPWRDVFRGYWGSLRFFGPTFWNELGFLQPAGHWTGESTRELRAGVGKLLIGSQRELSPVVILYSYASLVAGSAGRYWEPRHGAGALTDAAAASREVLEQLLVEAGVSFGYQTAAQVARGALAGKKLLIIPRQMGLALSKETVKAIEQFVRDGGNVLADLAPGLCDEHGKPRAASALDALFGVRTGGENIVYTAPEYAARVQLQHALLPQGEWLLDPWYDRGLRVSDGRAGGQHVLDGTPAFVVKQTGRGRSLLLNLLLTPPWPGKPGASAEQRALMASVLRGAGVPALARVEGMDGVEVNRFQDGASQYYGFYAHAAGSGDGAQGRVYFADERETYDVRAGRYLGRVSELPLALREGGAALIARLDYQLQALSLSPPPKAARGELLRVPIALRASGTPGRHVVHVELQGPGGAPLPLYTQNLEVVGGRAELQLLPALNDPAGRWQIEAREVISGLTANAAVELQ